MSKTENQNVPTIAQLRKAGWKVRVQHERELKLGRGMNIELAPRGGKTYVSLIPPGNHFTGEAKCNESDSYCKKEGVKLAIQRALSKYDGELAI